MTAAGALRKILVFGYGNPGRNDDGLGPALIDRLEERAVPGVAVDCAYQLSIEDAANIAEYDAVIFVDAEREGAEPYSVGAVQPAVDITFTSHLISPESVVALCEQMYGKTPDCWLMGVRGYDFDFGETLTERAEENLEKALSFVIDFVEKKIQEGKEYEHNGTQDNPHHR